MKQSRYNVWVEHGDAHYVYNGMTGALLRVSPDDHTAVERVINEPDARDCSVRVLEQLVRGRMILQDEVDEVDLLARRYELTRYDTSHLGMTIITSLGCNFDCPYCFEAKHPSILRGDVMEAVLGVLDSQLEQIDSFQVTWFGGEPLVGKKPLLELSDAFIERCDAANVSYSAMVITNGYLLDEDMCRDLRDRRVSAIQVSLDGPPEIHDRMRPLANGDSTFWRIVKNLHHAVDYFSISVRMNVDVDNFPHTEELLKILEAEGLSGKLAVYPGQIVGVNDGAPAPSASYSAPCMTVPEFARAELEFTELATRYGFYRPSVPSPSGAPCTAVRKNEIVVGSEGELYKCWDSVGNKFEEVGTIFDYANPNGRIARWLNYDPFADEECRTCIALPACMGGCAHHGMDVIQHENRCSTFRTSYKEQVLQFVDHAERNGTAVTVAPTGLSRRVDPR
jgi:uncharacterized protein